MQFINLILYKNIVLERYFQSKWCIKIHRDAEHWNNARSFLFLASNKVSQPPELSCPHFSVPGLYKFKVRRNLCFIKNVNQKQQTNVNISCKHKHAFNTTMFIFFSVLRCSWKWKNKYNCIQYIHMTCLYLYLQLVGTCMAIIS